MHPGMRGYRHLPGFLRSRGILQDGACTSRKDLHEASRHREHRQRRPELASPAIIRTSDHAAREHDEREQDTRRVAKA